MPNDLASVLITARDLQLQIFTYKLSKAKILYGVERTVRRLIGSKRRLSMARPK